MDFKGAYGIWRGFDKFCWIFCNFMGSEGILWDLKGFNGILHDFTGFKGISHNFMGFRGI